MSMDIFQGSAVPAGTCFPTDANSFVAFLTSYLKGDDASIQAALGALGVRVTAAEGTIVNHTAELLDHENRITALETSSPFNHNGRLTIATANPVPTTNLTGNVVFYTPYLGSSISLYNGTAWQSIGFTEVQISMAGAAADTNFDIFGYNNAGTLVLEKLAWSSDTARATNIILVDGVYVKNGDNTRKYLGTVRTNATIGQVEDSVTKRYVFNEFNRVERNLEKYISATWAHPNVWRLFNADATARLDFVLGHNFFVKSTAKICIDWASSDGGLAIGLNSTTVPVFETVMGWSVNTNSSSRLITHYNKIIATGYNFITGLDVGGAGNASDGDSNIPSNSGAGQDECYIKAEIMM